MHPTSAVTPEQWKHRNRLALAGAGMLFLLYLPFLNGGFILDDVSLIELNPALGFGNLADFFTHSLWYNSADRLTGDGVYRPLVLAWYTLVRGAAGASPLAFHLANLALLALNGVLVARLAARALPTAGPVAHALAGVVYALHPAHVQTVLWAVGGAESLAVAFTLGSAVAFFAYRERGGAGRLALALGLFAAAVLTKESAVMLPVVLAVSEFVGRRRRAPAWGAIGGFLAVLGAYAAVRSAAIGAPPLELTPAGFGRVAETAVLSLRHALAPYPQPFYMRTPAGGVVGGADLAFAAAALVLFGAALRRFPGARMPLAAAALLWLPTAGLALMPNGVFAMRYLALPLASAAVAAAAVWHELALPPRHATAAAAGLVMAAAVGVLGTGSGWAGEAAFGRMMLAYDPQSTMAYDLMAREYKKSGAWDKLIGTWQQLADTAKDEGVRCRALDALANTAREVDQAAVAREAFHRMQACPGTAEKTLGAVGEGNLLWGEKRYGEALEAYRRASAWSPDDFLARYNEANLLETLGRRDEAAVAYERVMALPRSADWDAAAVQHARDFVAGYRHPGGRGAP
jgi:tetratricopeptide (TPR) repeat protein